MKIVGLEKNSFIAPDGTQRDYYLAYAITKNANIGGTVVGTYDVKKAVLDNALNQIEGKDYKELINHEFDASYTYNKDKRRSKIDILNLVK